MKEKFKNLIDVKSIVTILLTIVVCILALKEIFDIKEIFIMIISFYFGTQHQKATNTNNDIINNNEEE